MFGAGGVARAVAFALAAAGVGALSVAVRDPGRAAELLEALEGTSLHPTVVDFDGAAGASADLVVNATPLGADGHSAPPIPALAPGVVVIDLLYRPAVTPLQAAARAAGAEAHGGLGLLLHQAALSFELWTGTPAPLDAMSAAALAALSGRR